MLQTILLIIIGVLFFSLVIFFHEFGHFFTAKLFKIRVNEFAIGMGPKIFSTEKGETKYSLRLLPIGGYCAMEGEDEDSDEDGAFNKKPVWQRMIVILAGAVMNILLGFILMFIMIFPQEKFQTTTVSAFAETSAMQDAGVQIGDKITKIDEYAIYTIQDLSFSLLTMANPDSVQIEVKRDGKKIQFEDVKLNSSEAEDGKRIVRIDFAVELQNRTIGNTITRSVTDTLSMVRMVLESLKGMISGRFGLNDMAGPVGTAQVISEAATIGLKESFGAAIRNIMFMIIVVTVNLGVVNLMPIPALDGGRMIFLLFELIFRRPVPQKYEAWVHTGGFVLLMLFMLVITFNDIVKLVKGG
jgi:Predicted membrane-associated Zn-dependent proteases 1